MKTRLKNQQESFSNPALQAKTRGQSMAPPAFGFDQTPVQKKEAAGTTLAGGMGMSQKQALEFVLSMDDNSLSLAASAMSETDTKNSTDKTQVSTTVDGLLTAITVLKESGISVGSKGELSGKISAELGSLKAMAEAKLTAFAGQASSSTVKFDFTNFNGFTVDAKGETSIGASVTAQSRSKLNIGRFQFENSMKADALAGARARANGKARLDLSGLRAIGAASAVAGVHATGEMNSSTNMGKAGLKNKLEVEASAGVRADAKGKASISLAGVEAEVSASALAGVKAAAKDEATLTLKGVPLITLRGEIEASAGIGGKIEGAFELKDGKLRIGGALAGTLGLGVGGGVEVEADLYAIGMSIADSIYSILD